MAGDPQKRERKRRKQAERRRADALRLHREASPVVDAWEFPSSEALEKDELPDAALTDESFGSDKERNLFFALINVVSRMNDHITRIDSGVYYAIDDLAVCLRVLLREGDGSGILLAAIDEFDVEMPEVVASPPAFRDTEFSVGAMPVLQWREGLIDEELGHGSLRDWLDCNVIRMGSGQDEIEVSWRKLIGDYANKIGGAHLQTRPLPAYLVRADWFGVAGLALTGFLLRTAAVLTYHLAQSTLTNIVRSLGLEVSETYRWGGMGSQPSEPSDLDDMGYLFHFSSNEHALMFKWFVDERTPSSRLRLFGNEKVWDYEYSKRDGLTANSHVSPVSEYLFQAPRNPRYPNLGPVSGLVIGRPFVYAPIVRTWQEMDAGVPHSWPDGFHPNLPAPGWDSTQPIEEGQYVSAWEDLGKIVDGKTHAETGDGGARDTGSAN